MWDIVKTNTLSDRVRWERRFTSQWLILNLPQDYTKKKLTQTKERHTNADMIHTEHEQTRLLNKIP